jgi:hypothetical protein
MDSYDADEYEQMVAAAALIGANAHLAVLLGGDAGRRGGEMRALEWSDVNFKKSPPLLRVERNDWRGQVATTKGNRVRFVPLTPRLAAALKRYRHMRSARVLCRADGKPYREPPHGLAPQGGPPRERAEEWTAHPAAHVLLAPGDERRDRQIDSGARGASRSRDDAALYAPEFERGVLCDRLLEVGHRAAKCGDISETASLGEMRCPQRHRLAC